MKPLFITLFLLLTYKAWTQIGDTGICHSGPVTLMLDTTWNHNIMESDLILYVEVEKTMMVTQAGVFSGKILQVIKGEFNDTTFSIYLELIEMSRERLEKRLGAICPPFEQMKIPYRCYLGFKKDKLWCYDPITDSKSKRTYYFFMSEKDLTTELKDYFLNRFLLEKLFKAYWKLSGV